MRPSFFRHSRLLKEGGFEETKAIKSARPLEDVYRTGFPRAAETDVAPALFGVSLHTLFTQAVRFIGAVTGQARQFFVAIGRRLTIPYTRYNSDAAERPEQQALYE